MIVSAGANHEFVSIAQISRGMLLIIMMTETAAGAGSECVPLRVLDIRDGSVLKVCTP